MTKDHLSAFIQKHRFKDTAALFIVFLSFNHFYLLCLLLFFIAATQQLDFLPNFLILSTLSKKPTRPAALTVTTSTSNDGYITTRSLQSTGHFQGHRRQSATTNTSSLPTPTVSKHAHVNVLGSENNAQTPFSGFKSSSTVRQHWSWLNTTLYLATEFGMATLLLVYAPSYFVTPIEALAISILVAFLIHDPRDSLNCATACTILYAVTLNIIKLLTLAPLERINIFRSKGKDIVLGTTRLSSRLPLIHADDPGRLYSYLSLSSSSLSPPSSPSLSSSLPLSSNIPGTLWWWLVGLRVVKSLWEDDEFADFNSDSDSDLDLNENDFNDSAAPSLSRQSSTACQIPYPDTNTKEQAVVTAAATDGSKEGTGLNSDGNANNFPSGSKSHSSQTHIVALRDDNVSPMSVNVNGPYFSSIVTNIKAYRAFSLDGNGKDTGNIDETNSYPVNNDAYELLVDLENHGRQSESQIDYFETNVSNTTNLEVFIRYLFSMRVRTLLPPLWSIFTTLRAANLEKRFLATTDRHNGRNAGINMNSELSHLLSGTYTTDKCDDDTKDVDTVLNSTTLVTQRDNSTTTNDNRNNHNSDFDRLNVTPGFAENSIFRRLDYEYKVRIADIGTHSLSFHIENLQSDDLMVLVNGLIWSEIEEVEYYDDSGNENRSGRNSSKQRGMKGYKGIKVNGLVPMYSYNIQIVSRLNGVNNLLIADFAVRTRSLGDSTNVGSNNAMAGEQGPDDLYDMGYLEEDEEGLPPYYRKHFSSPLLTLRHSILTTNTNLEAERAKLKKTKKEVNKQLGMLRQEIEYYKGRIEQSTVTGEKNLSKVENLKTALQQNELTLEKLENSLEQSNKEEQELETIRLEKKTIHSKKELDYSRAKAALEEQHSALNKKVQNLRSECNQLATKSEKLDLKNKRILKDMEQTSEMFRAFSQKKEKERGLRKQARINENNELEQTIRTLEQQISSIMEENKNMCPMAGSS